MTDVSVGRATYSASMDERLKGLIRHPSVTIEAAAELTNVPVARIRDWATRGAIEIETRGDMEVVRLEDVRRVARRQRASKIRRPTESPPRSRAAGR